MPVISNFTLAANPANVLSMSARADVRVADSVVVRFGLSATDSATPAVRIVGDSARLLLLGLRASMTYRAQPVAFNACGSTAGDVLLFTTGVLPADLPTYTAAGTAPSPGYVVFAAGNYGLVIDNTGRVVWYHRFVNGPGLNFQAQPNGRFVARPAAGTALVPVWIEIGADNTVTRTMGCARGLVPRLHDMLALEDGSYWLLCDETRTVDLSAQGDSPSARVLGTGVQHRSAAGDLLFEWSPFDHLAVELDVLDPNDRSASVINWTHGNAFDLDADGNLLVSFRNLNEVVKIDTRTGALLWRLGGAHNQFAFDAPTPAFVHQHGVRARGNGVLLLDNLGEPGGSRAERYVIDATASIARMSAAYGMLARLTGDVGGSAQGMSDGHTLVSFGSGNGVEEYDATGTMVWKLLGSTGYVFRAQRVRSLYTPGVGDAR
jgi:hypothetical protein